MFWRRKKKAVDPERQAPFIPMPSGRDVVRTFYRDGSSHTAHAFKIDWNNVGLVGWCIVEKGAERLF
ncbi:hypothetical protein NKH72_21865 [Mesorhizobium sp. M0955]|uniref:hypothetical protein n=1 Tax=Mesorhizobium sp. M0955 TaxID=2957033 RepID=UPI00333A75E5